MKKIVFVVALLGLVVSPCFAQQDPDDPGLPDSLIIPFYWTIYTGVPVYIPVYAVTDDSVAFYNVPLRWHAPEGGVYFEGIERYYFPINTWDIYYDTIMTEQGYVREIGWANIDSAHNIYLHSNGQRLQVWLLHFFVELGAPRQYVVIDTTWDERNGSVLFGLDEGVTEITPIVKTGILFIDPLGVDDDITTPKEFSLSQNYPNPFNPTTLIEFGLPQESHTQLVVYNLLGQTIKTIIDEVKAPGAYSITWDGTDNSGNPQPSGTYFYSLTTSTNNQTRRMTLIR